MSNYQSVIGAFVPPPLKTIEGASYCGAYFVQMVFLQLLAFVITINAFGKAESKTCPTVNIFKAPFVKNVRLLKQIKISTVLTHFLYGYFGGN